MAEYLVIRIGHSEDAPADWIAVDASGARQGPPITGPLSEAHVDIGERTVIVLVPSTEVLTTTVDMPIRGGAKMLAALPYALEEQLADDVDQLHFAAGTRRSSGKTPVSVVNRDRLAQWLSWLEQTNIEPDSMVADIYGLARIPGTISLLVAEQQVVINDGADVELVMEGVSPGDALAAIGAFDEGTADTEEQDVDEELTTLGLPRHVLVYCAPEDEERYQHDWIAMRQELDSLDVKLLADGVLPRLAVTVATGAGINLLQGEYGLKTDYSGALKPWKYAAMLFLALGIVAIGGKTAGYFSLKHQLATLQNQFHLEYQQLVPGAALPRDPAAAVQSLLSRTGSAQSPQIFLRSLEQLSQAVSQNGSASIQAISFRGGVVDVRLTAPDVATLDNIQRAIALNGRFRATIQSTETDQEGGKVNSRIQIQEGGA
jgi:general secretion pathway protein L